MAKRTDVRKWAVIGAEQRLLQISEEAAAIYRAFPELRRGGRGRGAAGRRSAPAADADASAAPVRKRRRLSAAARKRISDAQKRRWAKQRAAKK